jgi:hypothetical protein
MISHATHFDIGCALRRVRCVDPTDRIIIAFGRLT